MYNFLKPLIFEVVLLTAMEFLRDNIDEEADPPTETSSNMVIGTYTSHEALTYTSSNMAICDSGADSEEAVPELKTTVFNDSFIVKLIQFQFNLSGFPIRSMQ